MTRSQINKLGRELRKAPVPDSETLMRLQGFRQSFDAPMAATQEQLRSRLNVQATSRLKTINTIIDKLNREKTRLAEMQDIAGLRIVQPMNMDEQDALAGQICDLFPETRVDDRRKKPKHGYRAVHVIATVERFPVEVQVRSLMQDLWAQAMERLSDVGGRGIRYGERPEGFATEIGVLQSLSPLIAQIETSQTNVSKGREQLEAMSEQLAEKGWQDGIVEARFLLDDASAALEGSFRTAQGILKELIARMEAR